MNLWWGQTIIDQLAAQGVEYFCLAPGFRSTPLVVAASKYKPFVHFDERGLGFHALGAAKATGKPVCIIVTSGTAVGNLMPAVMEADADGVPLILLTSDRPPNLRKTMANQTGDQVKIFGDHVRYFFDLPTPSEKVSEGFISTTIAEACSKALFPLKGPVQLNCPFSEPFLDEERGPSCTPVSVHHPKLAFDEGEVFADKLEQIEKGVIVLGRGADCPSAKALSKKLGWPIFADITSGCRKDSVPYYHHILKSHPELKPDAILHLGGPVVSKVLLGWMQNVIHVSEDPRRCDPHHLANTRVICPPEEFCEKVLPHLYQKPQEWKQEIEGISGEIHDQILLDTFSEPGITKTLLDFANPKTALFLGNSMPIRDADMFFFPESEVGPIFANRGLSGIDGNIATICGIAHKYPVIAVIGDQTFLHDLNSLAQLKKTKQDVKLIVINNGGGGIFSFVAIGERKDVLDPYFAAAHNLSFENAARLFDLPYRKIDSLEDLEAAMKKEGSLMIEALTNREENHKLHKEIDTRCLSFSTVS